MRVHNTFLTKTNKNYKYSLLPRALLFFFFFFLKSLSMQECCSLKISYTISSFSAMSERCLLMISSCSYVGKLYLEDESGIHRLLLFQDKTQCCSSKRIITSPVECNTSLVSER